MTETVGPSVLEILWQRIAHGINWQFLYEQRGSLYEGAKITLLITVCAIVIGVMLGLFLAIMRNSRRRWLRAPVWAYTEVFRCTPMTVQILLFYFAVFPGLQEFNEILRFWPSMDFAQLDAIYAGIAAQGLNSAAYLSEIFRGGIMSIDRGQREAALSLGMREYQVMYHVVLPQALANALPALANEFITMIKDSSLLSIIAVAELTYRARIIGNNNFESFTMYFGAGIIYFMICFPTSRLIARLEKKMRTGQK